MAILGTSENCTLCRASDSTYVPRPHSSSTRHTMWGFGRSGLFLLPPQLTRFIEAGMELGHADDLVFTRQNSKHSNGTVGLLTNGLIDRKEYYIHAIKLGMIAWIRPELYAASS